VLTEGGCLVQNFHTNGKQHPEGVLNRQLRKATAVLTCVFSNCLAVPSLDSRDHYGNTLVLASSGACLDQPDESAAFTAAANRAQVDTKLRFDVAARVRNLERCSPKRANHGK
jgi:hypothetical protein